MIEPENWENIPEFVVGKKQTFSVRVLYQAPGERPAYSVVYTLIVALGISAN